MSLLFLAGASASLILAQETPLTALPYTPSLATQFMDKSVDPCMDFYKYACGNWNKLNPIPPDQARWEVYSKMTNENQRFLWGILEQAARPGPSRTANQQKIGDYFRACMDETAVESAGAKPLEPMLAGIAKLKSINDISAYVSEPHKTGMDRGVLFGFGSDQDYDNSSQMIATVLAGGLGLPDRDYYTKADPKSQEVRQRYLQHVQRMLEMIGESTVDARSDAQSVMRIETALAQASLTRVEKRNPYNLKHKYSRDDLMYMAPLFDWDVYLSRIGVPDFQTVNITEPKFLAEVNTELKQENLAAWRAYLR